MSSLEQMSRDELEGRVETLEEELEELRETVEEQPSRLTFNVLMSNLMNVGLDDYTQDPGQLVEASKEFGSQVKGLDRRISKVEEIAEEEETLSNDPSVSNWQAIVEEAQKKSGHRDHALPNNRVKLFKKQVSSAVGCSERHALTLIEEYGEEKRGVEWQAYKRHKSGDVQQKAIKIDLNVWGDGDE